MHHALAYGISRGFLLAAAIAVLALAVVIATIRLRREDIAGGSPLPAMSEASDVLEEREPEHSLR